MKQQSVRLELEQLEDRLAPAAFTVTTSDDNGINANPTAGSLRAAIVAVNAGKFDAIDFNIKDAGGKQIVNVAIDELGNALPTITKPVTIDGSTAPGQQVEIRTTVDFTKQRSNSNGLTFGVGADGSQVQDLIIDGFRGDGIDLKNVSWVVIGGTRDRQFGPPTPGPVSMFIYANGAGVSIEGADATNNRVMDSYIGKEADPQRKRGNTFGVVISDDANYNTIGSGATIGGKDFPETNVISGNSIYGVFISRADNNIVSGNFIGTDLEGTTADGNGTGVYIKGASTGNKIGVPFKDASVPEAPANLISGNDGRRSGYGELGDGVYISDQAATGNTVAANWIGVDSSGVKPLPNRRNGVELSRTTGNTIGGESAKFINVISGNGADGVFVNQGSTKNVIRRNNIGIGPDDRNLAIEGLSNVGNGIHYDNTTSENIDKGTRTFKNAGKAVDDSGGKNKTVDPNLMGDNGFGIYTGTEAGAPVLNSAVVSGNTITITGTLSSTPSSSFTLEFFGNTDLDQSGSAEGEFYLGNTIVTTDTSGNASFTVTFNAVYGTYITATATGNADDGSTSQFSLPITATGESQTAAVGGNVWDDTNADGLPDSGEGDVSAVNVQLFTAGGTLVASTTADANGNYLFTNVAPGNYYLQSAAPSGYFFTTPYQGDDTIASHADPTTGDTEQFSLIAGEVDPYYNAGLIPTSLHPATTTTLDSTQDPSVYGDEITFTATVAQTDVVPLGGTVTFMDGSNVLGTVDVTSDFGSYRAMFTTADLSLGDHPISANYSGDGFHAGSSAALTQTVLQGFSSTSLSSSLNPAAPGQSITFTTAVTATINDSSVTPTGTVTFEDGDTVLATVALDANGNAAFTTSSLTGGTHTITAVYSGDDNVIGSSDSLTQTVSQEISSSTSLSSSANPAVPDEDVTFTATVSGFSGTPTGTVTFFMDDDIPLDTVTLDANGNATLTTSFEGGTYTITATYSGDGTYAGSTASLTQTVVPTEAVTYLSSDVNPAQLNQAVTFTATVSGGDGIPTGSVTFLDGTTTLSTVTLSAIDDFESQAVFTILTLDLGKHTITAVYSGDTAHTGSAAFLTQTVQLDPTTTFLTSSLNPTVPSNPVTFIAGVSTADFSIPTGSITFYDGTTVLGTGTLDASGIATITTSALALGDHDITAIYSGAPTYAGSSAFMTQTIALDRTGMLVSADVNQSQPGQEVTFTATVYTDLNDGTPIGSVTFFNGTTALGSASLDATGSASLTTSFAAAGNYTIVAIYSGNEWYAGSSARTEQTVGQSSLASTATELITSASPSLPGQPVTFTATVEGLGVGGTPTGSVKFFDGTTLLGMETLDANGSATYTTSTLALGDHNITAIYAGDDTYFGSTYTIVQPVERGETSISLTSSALPSLPGQAVTFTATVSAMAGGTPTGSVTFYDGTSVLGTVTLDANGNATFTTLGLWLGDHNITAIYSGDAAFATSSSSLMQSVLKFDSTTTLTASANPSPLGQPVTFTATVAADIGTPTGTVNFYDGTTLLGTGTLSLVNGQMQATFTTAAMGFGGHTIVAIYSGDSTFADSGAWLEEGVI